MAGVEEDMTDFTALFYRDGVADHWFKAWSSTRVYWTRLVEIERRCEKILCVTSFVLRSTYEPFLAPKVFPLLCCEEFIICSRARQPLVPTNDSCCNTRLSTRMDFNI
jgi:hypothetical protein